MKTLIVFYSFSGNNKVLARYLQKKSGADLQKIVELKPHTGFSILLSNIPLSRCCGTGGNKKITTGLTRLVDHAPEPVLALLIKDLLSPEKKNKIRYTSGYQVHPPTWLFSLPALKKLSGRPCRCNGPTARK